MFFYENVQMLESFYRLGLSSKNKQEMPKNKNLKIKNLSRIPKNLIFHFM